MKRLLILLSVVSIAGISQAKPFSMDDYKAKTGKTVKAVEAKKDAIKYPQLIRVAESKIDLLNIKLDKLGRTRQMITENFSNRSAKIAAIKKGDKTAAMLSLNTARKTKMNGLKMEEENIKKDIENYREKLAYYELAKKAKKKRRSLVMRGILKSQASV